MGNRCCVSFLLCELDRGIETLLSCLLDACVEGGLRSWARTGSGGKNALAEDGSSDVADDSDDEEEEDELDGG